MISSLVPIFYLLIFGVPVASVTTSFLLAQTIPEKIAVAFFSPVIFTVLYIFTAGLLSRIGKRGVIPGIFSRDLKHPVYGPRRLYSSAWTAVYYFTPLYFVALSVPVLKKMLFRLFGYTHSMNFTVYPDTWLRDLPCVKFEDGAYLANKSTIGTNICLSDGRILVDRVKVGSKTVVGHGAMLAPGSALKENCELGPAVALGIRTKIHEQVKTGGYCVFSHGSVIEANTRFSDYCYVGLKARIGTGLILEGGTVIPAGAHIQTQEEVANLQMDEASILKAERTAAMRSLRAKRTQQGRPGPTGESVFVLKGNEGKQTG